MPWNKDLEGMAHRRSSQYPSRSSRAGRMALGFLWPILKGNSGQQAAWELCTECIPMEGLHRGVFHHHHSPGGLP